MLGPFFSCIALSPGELGAPGIAIAAARAGGIGVLDIARCGSDESVKIEDSLRTLLAQTPPASTVGLRLGLAQVRRAKPLLDLIGSRSHILIVRGRPGPKPVPAFERVEGRTTLAEVESVDEAEAWQSAWPKLDGFIAAAGEAGGWCSASGGFVLAQALLAADLGPVYVRGGLGENGAAALRVGGCAGVVLDDQLLLMPESPLPEAWRALLERVEGHDSALLGEHLDARCRVLGRPAFPCVKEFAAREAALEIADEPLPKRQRAWRSAVEAKLRFGPPDSSIWPIGQAIGLAASYRARYRTTGRLVQAILKVSKASIDVAARLHPLAAGGPLAVANGTAYAVVQGPMTRVSDTPAFAAAVARAGALPMLALGVMSGEQVVVLLEQVRSQVGDLPWGAGILGFMDPEVRKAQLAAVCAAKPRFALVAGGRSDVAEELEAAGIATYLHVPTVALLRSVFRRGLRRFVFEGRECGGHVGPLGSLALWESMVPALLSEVTNDTAGECHVLFAGGIHDARSAAMVSALAAPLSARGIKIGVLMGTAYVFTRECMETGAVGPVFQQEVLSCRRTVLVESAPGHANRCIETGFCRDFGLRRRELRRRSAPLEEQRAELDDLLLGRLRMASKGLWREGGGPLVKIDAARQEREGMFMIGEVATLREARTTLADLHRDIAEGSERWLARASLEPAPRVAKAEPLSIAIVGMAMALPGAATPDAFWANLQRRSHSISEIPGHRWDWHTYFDADPKSPDRIVSRWGGFIDPLPFDPVRFGLPPSSLPDVSVAHPIALELTRRALVDAGYAPSDIDRERAAVIFGAAETSGLSGKLLNFRSLVPALLGELPPALAAALPAWSADSLAGHITNVIAGRVANRFDFGGPNFTVDAACASSLAAIDAACRELASGHASIAIAGGFEIWQSPFEFIAFSKTGALSPAGQSRPFDAAADGIVISEGAVVLVLKRLTDAERDGDRIYAVIKSIAGSSDGKALGMTAPRPVGQMRAMRRAYERAGFSAATLGLYEAHGTGTPVGDRAEVISVTTLLREHGTPARACALGSVKAHIGHTGSTAGSASLVKAALALYHRTLPLQTSVEKPVPALAEPNCPVFLLDEARPWLSRPDAPRRAGVSAFGFGGTNFHAVLEEYQGALVPAVPGGEVWPAELLILAGRDRNELAETARSIELLFDRNDPPSLRAVAYACAKAFGRGAPGAHVATVVARDAGECRFALTRLAMVLTGSDAPSGDARAQFTVMPDASPPVAFLFPGQGSPYPNMAREATLYLPELRDAIERADRVLAAEYPAPLSAAIFPSRAFDPAEREAQRAALRDTAVAQPAIGAVSIGFLALLRRLGIKPSMLAGHSYGEWVALHAAGVFDAEELLRHSARRGRLMKAVSVGGGMAAIVAPRDVVERELPRNGRTVVANHNTPSQSVVSGPSEAVDALIEAFGRQGVRAVRLPVAGAFHSPLMADAQAALANYIDEISLAPPTLPVYGNADGAIYDPRNTAQRLKTHLLSPVEFATQVQRMHSDGARIFVEVGPGSVLTNLVKEILPDGDRLAVALDGSGGSITSLLLAVGALWRAGVALDVTRLFDGRVDPAVDLNRLTAAAAPDAPGWLVDGQSIWRVGDPIPNPLARVAEPIALSAESSGPAEIPVVTGAAEIYAAYQETMRQFLAAQERVLGQVLRGQPVGAPGAMSGSEAALPAASQVPPLRPASGSAEEPPAPVLSAPAAAPPPLRQAPLPTGDLDRGQLAALIAEVAAECTGYPREMLGLREDVEAELGIGSIKRLEILEALGPRLPPRFARRLKAAMDEVALLKTFSEWADTLFGTDAGAAPSPVRSNGSATDPISPSAPRAAPAVVARRQDCARSLVRGAIRPLKTVKVPSDFGPILITEDGFGVAREVLGILRERGVAVAMLSRDQVSDKAGLASALARLRPNGGRFRGVLHLAGIEQGAMPASLDQWQGCTERHSKSLVRLLRLLADDLRAAAGTSSIQVVSGSLLGGRFGRAKQTSAGLPSAGGPSGLLRTIEREWRGVRCKVVDFDADQPARRIARWLVDELVAPPDGFEIGYPDGERTVYTAVAAPLEAGDRGPGLTIADDWIVLATGGARGITAEIVRSWAKPGMTFILVGRSPLEDASDPAPVDPAATRAGLIARDQAAGLRRRPAEVEREVVETLRRQEVARTVADLRALGAKVEYHAVDVRDDRRFGALIADVYARHGRIDTVLHGAGVIEDKRLVDKTDASIDRVFDTKVDSAFNLYRSLRPVTLKAVVFFASVAGRNGNPGQADYAAANEVLNRLALRMAVEWPTVRVLSINWGPWTGVGMAVEALKVMGQRFAPIEPEAGCRFLRDELERGSSADVEVIAGETSPATVASAIDPEATIGDGGSDAFVDATSGN